MLIGTNHTLYQFFYLSPLSFFQIAFICFPFEKIISANIASFMPKRMKKHVFRILFLFDLSGFILVPKVFVFPVFEVKLKLDTKYCLYLLLF